MNKRISIFIIFACINIGISTAQRLIDVTGRTMQIPLIIENKEKVAGPIEPFPYVHVYGLATESQANDVIGAFEMNYHDRNETWEVSVKKYGRGNAEVVSAIDGTYTVKNVPENGWLVFLPYEGNAKKIPVNGFLELEDLIWDMSKDGEGTITLGNTVVIGKEKGPKIDVEEFGNVCKINTSIPFIQELLKKNVRIVIQPYFMECNLDSNIDTLFLTPIIFYNNENELTQERRQGFNLKLDTLHGIAVDSIEISSGYLPIKRVAKKPDPKRYYKAYAELFYEDYNGILQQEKYLIKHCESNEPMKFLDFDFGASFLSPTDPQFRVEPKKENHEAVGDINLAFLNGKAELDSNNPNNDIEIARLQDEMLAIENSGSNFLRSLTIIGKASPEGSYESNRSLAGRRISFAMGKIMSAFNQYTKNRLKITQTPIVAGWDEVADSMAIDSLFTEAEEVRSIVQAHEGDMKQQSIKIKNLPYYKSVIEKIYLPKLRTVKYQYTFQTMRALTDAEILSKYEATKDSVGKDVFFNRYEYWRLVNKITDSTELANIYKAYYEFTKKQHIQDELAACNHAAFCIQNGIGDSTILAPYIHKSRSVNWHRENTFKGIIEWFNREAIVANQLAMYVLCKDYLNAGIMSNILPNNNSNRLLRAFVKCLQGYYDKSGYSDPVAASSPNNRVVISIAQGNLGVAKAVAEMELEDDNPRKFYFLAQIAQKSGEEEKTTDYLVKCFELDESFVTIAENDATFVDNRGNKKAFVTAVDKFKNQEKE